MESVPYQVEFDAFIKWTICAETGQVVDLNEPRLQLLIYHDVHAEDLEADRVLQIIWLARAVCMRQSWLDRDARLHANVLNLVHHVFSAEVGLRLLHVVQYCRQGALRPSVVIHVVVLHEVARGLVDRVIGQVHEQIIQVCLRWACILLSGKASESLLEHEDSEWVNSIDQHVDSEVKLQVVDQVGLVHVALGHKLIARLQVDVLVPPRQVNTFALAHVHGLDDECLCLLLVKLVLEVVLV